MNMMNMEKSHQKKKKKKYQKKKKKKYQKQNNAQLGLASTWSV